MTNTTESLKLYSYDLKEIKIKERTEYISTTVNISLAPPLQNLTGHDIEVTLRLAKDESQPISEIRRQIAGEVPRILKEAAELLERNLTESGDSIESKAGLT
ncbi:hypothetical protein [Pontivivens nitratireducens]|uniref:hypothetical protein n=1 Tax=Pontivivens nitratireducens TaxID=2758038 RepID=UPI001C8D57EC|nr:hypothetical protein [Pontibrevibacter nitratireducens]